MRKARKFHGQILQVWIVENVVGYKRVKIDNYPFERNQGIIFFISGT